MKRLEIFLAVAVAVLVLASAVVAFGLEQWPQDKWTDVRLVDGWRCFRSDEIINAAGTYPAAGPLDPGGRWVHARFTALTLTGAVVGEIKGGIPKTELGNTFALTNATDGHLYNSSGTLYNSTGAHTASDELNTVIQFRATTADVTNSIDLWEFCVCGQNCGF